MSEPIPLDPCHCCEGPPGEPTHVNPPALTELSYRVGTHPTLLERMTTRIHAWEVPSGDRATQRTLASLSTRAPDDAAIALMDAWAVVGDVITFYQERIANEGFLRTATERLSVLEMARAIGYELDPGVAASAHVAFTVDDADGSPLEASVPAGTQILSIPASGDERPQTFETSQDLTARVAMNAMLPRLRHPQDLVGDPTRLYVEGAGAGLSRGDRLLLVIDGIPSSRRIVDLVEDAEGGRTRIDLATDAEDPDTTLETETEAVLDPAREPLPLTRENVEAEVFERHWSETNLQALLTLHEWDAAEVSAHVADIFAERLAGSGEVHRLRERARIFGHNAPVYLSLPAEMRPDPAVTTPQIVAYPHDWDAGWEIWKDSQTGGVHADADVYLAREVSDLAKGSWVVLKRKGTPGLCSRVASVVDASLAGFGMSGQVTGLHLEDADGDALTGADKDAGYLVRNTVAHLVSESLTLATIPVTGTLPEGRGRIALGGMVLGLRKGQPVVLEGVLADTDGRRGREVLVLDEITHLAGRTRLTFEDGLAATYERESVTLAANVVTASHGETVSGEVLGSGDGSAANQSFDLKSKPLTYVSAPTTAGSESTLELRVDGVRWNEVPSLHGLDGASRSFVVRIDDAATPRVIFGDGRTGARLTTGLENVTATYRSGIGSEGEVGAKSLTLLKTRPFGIRAVTNPLAASGADDPEKLDDARDNAPLTVLTLDRIVSLRDYEDFARAFPGIGKARADTVWDGRAEVVHITVADADGDTVVEPLLGNLLNAMEGARDPLREMRLASYEPRVFFLEAKVLIDEAYLREDVEAEIESALLTAFDFEHRSFGQPVTAAEILEIAHGIEPVIAVDIDALYETAPSAEPSGPLLNAVLPSAIARWESGELKPARLLLIHPLGIALSEMTP